MAGWAFENDLTTDGRELQPLLDVQREFLASIDAKRYITLLRTSEGQARSAFLKRIGAPHQRPPERVACRQIVSRIPRLEPDAVRHLLWCIAHPQGLVILPSDSVTTEICESTAGEFSPEAVTAHLLLALDPEHTPSVPDPDIAQRHFYALSTLDSLSPEALTSVRSVVAVPSPGEALDLRSIHASLMNELSAAVEELEAGLFPDPASLRAGLLDLERVAQLAEELGVEPTLNHLEEAFNEGSNDEALRVAVESLTLLRGVDEAAEAMLAQISSVFGDPAPYADALVAISELVHAQAEGAEQAEVRRLFEEWIAAHPCPLDHDEGFFTAVVLGRISRGESAEPDDSEEAADELSDEASTVFDGEAADADELTGTDSRDDMAEPRDEPMPIAEGPAEPPDDTLDTAQSESSAQSDPAEASLVEPLGDGPDPSNATTPSDASAGEAVTPVAATPQAAPSTSSGSHVESNVGENAAPPADDLVTLAVGSRRFGLARQLLEERDELEAVAALDILVHAEGFRTPTPRSDSVTSLPEINDLLALGAHEELARLAPIGAAAVALRLVLLGGYSSGAVPWAESLAALASDKDAAVSAMLEAAVAAAQAQVHVQEAGLGENSLEIAVSKLTMLRERASQLVDEAPNRTFLWRPASALYQRWLRIDGRLGGPLAAFAAEESGWVERAKAAVEELSSRDDMVEEINRDHRNESHPRHRKGKATMITARALEQLLENITIARDLLSDAIDSELSRSQAVAGRRGGAARKIHDLRSSFERFDPAADVAVVDGLGAALDQIGHSSLTATKDWIIEGRRLPDPVAREAPALLALDLAYDPDINLVEIDGRWQVAGGTVDEERATLMLTATEAERWDELSARARIEHGDVPVVNALMDSMAVVDDHARTALEEFRREKLDAFRSGLQRNVRERERQLNSARSLGRVTEEDWPALSGLLEQARTDLEEEQLARSQSLLDQLETGLAEARDAAHAQLSERFDTLRSSIKVSEADRARVKQCLADDRLATAEEYLATLRTGAALPVPADTGERLGVFFPAMNDEIVEHGRIDARTARQAEKGGKWGPLHFERLSEAERRDASEGLAAWSSLRSGNADADLLRPILTVLGVEGAIENRRGGGRDRQAFAVTKFRRNGKAWVPEFGSRSGGHDEASLLNLLVVSSEVGVELLAQWANNDERGTPLMVLYSGSISASDRRSLLNTATGGHHFVAIDDALFAYVASAGGRSYDRTMRLSLPFTQVNPYRPGVAGQVAEEMFYGRLQELNEVMDLQGSGFVFGGRQLGKSALLVEARRRFRRRPGCESVYLDLRGLNVGTMGGRPAFQVWEFLWQELHEAGVVSEPGARVSAEGLKRELHQWLSHSGERRLLILLDECDAFLETDAQARFTEVGALKELMDSTERRVKIVIAGLHRVHRYDRVENHPLEHLGRPIAVGPLLPQAANDLIARPAAALGFTFEDDELVAQIQAIANNQPKQIVQFMRELLQVVQKQRLDSDEPPRVIKASDVERTQESPELIEELRRTFDLTIRMDNAYRIIAYVMAFQARKEGPHVVVQESELRKEATEWWPQGLGSLGRDAFRSLCEELTVLGVLSMPPDRSGYRLRTPSLLRLLGSEDQIQDALLEASEEDVEARYDARQHRRVLDTGRLSPLAQDQVAELATAGKSQVRLVIGTSSAGAHAVGEAITKEAEQSRRDIRVYTLAASDSQASRHFKPQGRSSHTIVVISCRDADDDRIEQLIGRAVDAVRGPRNDTVGVVFVADEHNEGLWRQALADQLPSEVGLVQLRQVSDEVLRHSAGVEDLPIAAQDERNRVIEAAGGLWVAVDRILQSLGFGESLSAAETAAAQRISDDAAPCRHMLESSDELRQAFKTAATLLHDSDDTSRADLEEFVSTADFDVMNAAGLLLVSDAVVTLSPIGRFLAPTDG